MRHRGGLEPLLPRTSADLKPRFGVFGPHRQFVESLKFNCEAKSGIVSPWGLDKAALSVCAARLCKLVLAQIVRDEVEENLLLHAERLPSLEGDKLIEHYRRLVKLTDPEMVPYPEEALVRSSLHLIRHTADVPVILSAMASKPDWLLTHNTKHFTQVVAIRVHQQEFRIARRPEHNRLVSAFDTLYWLGPIP